jgi:uncharacterized protein involved in outer membrane biogenesis
MTKKTFRIVVIIFVIVAVAAVAIVVVNLGRIIKEGVDVYGPQITKVSVTVDQVNIGLFTGSAEVKNLLVGNPTGYTAPQAVNVGDVHMVVDPTTVLSDKLVIRSINVESPDITFEGGLSGNNLTQILDNINGTARTNSATVTTSTGKAKAAKKLEVDDLVISGAKVHVTLNGLGSREIPLPDIHLSNLGTGPNGITPAGLTSQVFSSLTSATVKAVESQITNLGGNATNLGKQSVNSLKSTLGNLFGK